MRRALIVAVVLAAATVAAPPAVGCSVTGTPTEAEYTAMADVVFEGVAGPHRDPNAGGPLIGSGDPIFWTFAVDLVVKGAVAPIQEVASSRSPASCGMTFQEGMRYRVFAKNVNGTLTTSLGSGTRPAPATTTTRKAAPPSTTAPRRIALTG